VEAWLWLGYGGCGLETEDTYISVVVSMIQALGGEDVHRDQGFRLLTGSIS
jgi:hypothetical protein